MRKILSVMLLALVANLSMAQTADQIISKYLEVTGGSDKWSKLTSVKMTAKTKAQGLDLPTFIFQKAPNKQKVMLSLQGKEIVQIAFDGTEAWGTNFVAMKAEKKDSEDSENMKNEQDFPDPFINYKQKGYSIVLEGEETIEGVACHKLKLIKKPMKVEGKDEENSVTYFFDKENGVPVMLRSVIKKGQGKGVAIDSYLSDYQEVNGLYFPFNLTQKVNGQAVATTAIEKVEINIDMADSVFAFPKQ
jgi:outer membrane lipoprotein-sorting protein